MHHKIIKSLTVMIAIGGVYSVEARLPKETAVFIVPRIIQLACPEATADRQTRLTKWIIDAVYTDIGHDRLIKYLKGLAEDSRKCGGLELLSPEGKLRNFFKMYLLPCSEYTLSAFGCDGKGIQADTFNNGCVATCGILIQTIISKLQNRPIPAIPIKWTNLATCLKRMNEFTEPEDLLAICAITVIFVIEALDSFVEVQTLYKTLAHAGICKPDDDIFSITIQEQKNADRYTHRPINYGFDFQERPDCLPTTLLHLIMMFGKKREMAFTEKINPALKKCLDGWKHGYMNFLYNSAGIANMKAHSDWGLALCAANIGLKRKNRECTAAFISYALQAITGNCRKEECIGKEPVIITSVPTDSYSNISKGIHDSLITMSGLGSDDLIVEAMPVDVTKTAYCLWPTECIRIYDKKNGKAVIIWTGGTFVCESENPDQRKNRLREYYKGTLDPLLTLRSKKCFNPKADNWDGYKPNVQKINKQRRELGGFKAIHTEIRAIKLVKPIPDCEPVVEPAVSSELLAIVKKIESGGRRSDSVDDTGAGVISRRSLKGDIEKKTSIGYDTSYLIKPSGSRVRVYELKHPAYLARLETGSLANMGALLALGEFGSDVDEIKARILKLYNILKERGIDVSSTPLSDHLLSTIVQDNREVNYTLLWAILHPNIDECIDAEDPNWWSAAAEALDATIKLYIADDENKQLVERISYGKGTKLINILERAGTHYNIMIPIGGDDWCSDLNKEIERNSRFFPTY